MTTPVFSPISTLTGSETFANASSSFYAFVVKTPGQKQKEMALGQAAGDSAITGIRSLRRQSVTASQEGRKLELGKWTSGQYEIEDGTILKIVANRSAPRFGDRTKSLQRLVRVRTEAALRKVSMHLSNVPERGAVADAHVYGRFDVLTPEQATAFGVVILPKFKHLFTDTFEDVLTCREEQPEISPMPTLEVRVRTTPTGDVEVAAVPIRKRHMGKL